MGQTWMKHGSVSVGFWGLLLPIIARRQNPKVETRKFCVAMHIRVSGVPETRSVFRRFLVTRFNTSVSTVCGCFRRIGMRPRGWRLGSPHSQLGHALSFTDVKGMRLACDNLTVLCPKEMFVLTINFLCCMLRLHPVFWGTHGCIFGPRVIICEVVRRSNNRGPEYCLQTQGRKPAWNTKQKNPQPSFAFCAFRGFLADGSPVPLLGVHSGLDTRYVQHTDDCTVFCFDRNCVAYIMQKAAI